MVKAAVMKCMLLALLAHMHTDALYAGHGGIDLGDQQFVQSLYLFDVHKGLVA